MSERDKNSRPSGDRKPFNKDRGKGGKPSFKKGGKPSFNRDKRSDDKGSGDRRPSRPEKDIPLTSAQLTRQLAATAVRNVRVEGLPLETVLSALPGYNELDPRDRAFVRLIAATTFRRDGQLKAVFKPLIRKDPPLFIRAALETAAAQILFLGTPPHAAVGETVGMLKSAKATRGFANLANAVLRKVVEEGPKLAGMEAPRANIPGWIRGAWERGYGRASVRKSSLQLIKDPPLDLTLKDNSDANTQKWADALEGEIIMPGTVRLSSIGNVAELEGYEDGAWWAQDVAATLPVRLLASEIGDLTGKTALDLCAAPGGKTMQLAALGANVTAVDKSDTRLPRIHQNLTRTKLEAEIICADALEWETDKKFDIVLLDAPCTATGTFRRHPDVLHNRTPKTLSQLVKLQDKLLPRAAEHVAPGGWLVFATCSLQPEEGTPRVEKFLESAPEFRPISLPPVSGLDMPEEAVKNGTLRTLPHYLESKGGMDGFFIAVMQKS